MREGVVTEIVALATRAANAQPMQIKEILGRQHLFNPKPDGTLEMTVLGGPGVQPEPIRLHTLTGLVAYLAHRTDVVAEEADDKAMSSAIIRDGALSDQVLVHVVNQNHIRVLSALDDDKGAYRTLYATADFEPLIGSKAVPFEFGKYVDLESFNIALQALFEDNPDRNRVALVTGTVRDENVRTSNDDGVTQRVTAQAGVVGAYETDVPNPVRLRPFRTFRELEQPESLFILRLRKSQSGVGPEAALFEADGAAWKVAAIEAIARFLGDKLPSEVTLLA